LSLIGLQPSWILRLLLQADWYPWFSNVFKSPFIGALRRGSEKLCLSALYLTGGYVFSAHALRSQIRLAYAGLIRTRFGGSSTQCGEVSRGRQQEVDPTRPVPPGPTQYAPSGRSRGSALWLVRPSRRPWRHSWRAPSVRGSPPTPRFQTRTATQ